MNAEERKNRQNNDDETDEIDNRIHVISPDLITFGLIDCGE